MIVSRVKDMAHQRGITTVKELAERAGVAYNTAHDLYTGRATRIGLDVLNRFCQALQAQPGDLFVWVADKEQPKDPVGRPK